MVSGSVTVGCLIAVNYVGCEEAGLEEMMPVCANDTMTWHSSLV